MLCVSLLEGLNIKRTGARELALVEEAMEHGKWLIALEPESARGYYCHGLALVLHGGHSGAPIDFIKGRARIEKALELDPTLEDAREWIRYAQSKGRM